jgi:O-antigen/teichoic acid export membrane protein
MLKKLNRDHVAQINSLSVFLGVGCFVLSFLLSIPLSLFFGDARLSGVILAMSTSFLITGFKSVPYSLLEKELRFKSLALIEGIQTIVQSVCIVVLASLDFGYWALVLGLLTGAACSTGLSLLQRPHAFHWPKLSALKDVVTLSRNIAVGRLSWYVYTNADFIVAGKFLGGSALGAYTVAWNLANIATNKVTAQIGRVAPAFFAAVQHDRQALSRYLLKITEGLAMITLPITWGLFLVADEFVMIVLGDKWESVVAPLRLLLIYASFRCLMTLPPHLLNATGESQFVMRNNLLGALLLPIMFYLGSLHGTTGIAWAWLLWLPIIAAPIHWRVFRQNGISALQYLDALRPAITASTAMALVVVAVRLSMNSSDPLISRLVLNVVGGGAAYAFVVLFFYKRKVENMREVLVMLRRGSSYVASSPAPSSAS